MNTVTLRAAAGNGDAFWQVYELDRRRTPQAKLNEPTGSGAEEK
jgi:hypothetical protein